MDSSNSAPFLLPGPGSAMDGGKRFCVTEEPSPASSNCRLLHAWKPWVKRVSRSLKKEPSLNPLWRKSVGQGLPSSTEKRVLSRGCVYHPRTYCLLLSVGSPTSSDFLWQVPKVVLKLYKCAEAGRSMPCPLPPGPTGSLRALIPMAD